VEQQTNRLPGEQKKLKRFPSKNPNLVDGITPRGQSGRDAMATGKPALKDIIVERAIQAA
jgi:hypothetical protein